MNYPIIEVFWLDANCSEGWQSIEDVDYKNLSELLDKKSVGYLLKKTDKFISIAQSYDSDKKGGQCDNIMTIPKSCIKKIRSIK